MSTTNAVQISREPRAQAVARKQCALPWSYRLLPTHLEHCPGRSPAHASRATSGSKCREFEPMTGITNAPTPTSVDESWLPTTLKSLQPQALPSAYWVPSPKEQTQAVITQDLSLRSGGAGRASSGTDVQRQVVGAGAPAGRARLDPEQETGFGEAGGRGEGTPGVWHQLQGVVRLELRGLQGVAGRGS